MLSNQNVNYKTDSQDLLKHLREQTIRLVYPNFNSLCALMFERKAVVEEHSVKLAIEQSEISEEGIAAAFRLMQDDADMPPSIAPSPYPYGRVLKKLNGEQNDE